METFHLNPQQQEAVDTIDGALLILAGAGTGKTRVIVQRIVNMMHHGISAGEILAVTFTNKAAREMRERVQKALPDARELPQVSTFHSFCIQVLHIYAQYLGYSRNFTLATEGYQNGLLREIAIESHLDQQHIDPYGWLANISRAKSALRTPADIAEVDPKLAVIYQHYDERLKRMNMMDFDDLLVKTVELWTKYPAILQAYQKHFRYLMIDEYQDTNHVQLEIMRLLAGTAANICAVGDDDQSIYGWRGADQRNILDYEKFFPKAKILRLEQNYRSSNAILKAANGLIVRNTRRREKALWSDKGEGEIPYGVRCEDAKGEAEFVAAQIYNRASGGNFLFSRSEASWWRYAILYRTSGQSRLLEEALRRHRIPFTIVGSKSFYQRKEILDILTLLELGVNPQNDMALARVINVPPRGVGDAAFQKLAEKRDITHLPMFQLLREPGYVQSIPPETAQNLRHFAEAVERIGQVADTPMPLEPVIRRMLEALEYEDRLIQMYKPRSDALERRENVREFLLGVEDYDREHRGKSTLREYLQMLALQDAGDRREKDRNVTENSVSLMTIHAAKGLEFPEVFVVGMEQGLFPHQMALDEGNLEEERRLCYVAMTRARERLLLVYAGKRQGHGTMMLHLPSVFLDEIPRGLVEFTAPDKLDKPMEAVDSSAAIDAILASLDQPGS